MRGRVLVASAVVSACGTHLPAAAPPPARPASARPAAVAKTIADETIFHELDVKLGTSGAVPPPSSARRARLQAFLADRMAQPAFYDHVAPEYVRLASGAGSLPVVPHTLNRDGDSYYLDTPCKQKDRIRIAPWWNMEASVEICRDDVRPEITSYDDHGVTSYCEGSERPFERRFDSPCRCGKNLINCAPAELQKQLIAALNEEQVRTFEYIVRQQLPLATSMMTIDGTVRSDLADLFYARAQSFVTGKLDYPAPQDGSVRLRPRPPHFDTGLLTTWPWLASDDGVRPRVAGLWGMALCINMKSQDVHPEQMFDAIHPTAEKNKAGNFRYSVHLELATTSGCDSCHRTLEHAALALDGYPVARFGSRYVPPAASATTQLYVDDNLRAEGPATIEWLAKALAAQPEIKTCVVDTTLHFLFDGFEPPAAERQRLIAMFAADENFGKLFGAVVEARYLPDGP